MTIEDRIRTALRTRETAEPTEDRWAEIVRRVPVIRRARRRSRIVLAGLSASAAVVLGLLAARADRTEHAPIASPSRTTIMLVPHQPVSPPDLIVAVLADGSIVEMAPDGATRRTVEGASQERADAVGLEIEPDGGVLVDEGWCDPSDRGRVVRYAPDGTATPLASGYAPDGCLRTSGAVRRCVSAT